MSLASARIKVPSHLPRIDLLSLTRGRHSHARHTPPSHVVVIGGGLTGLSSAFHLSRRFPAARITLVEKQPRLGGWVRSERVQVKLGGDPGAGEVGVLLESGPRTLRPNGLAVLELINLLGLSSSVITVSRSAPAARNRFLHLPGTSGLLVIPSSHLALFASPLGRILLSAVLKEIATGQNKPVNDGVTSEYMDDESVDSFMSRRFGHVFSRTFASALVHGIYAADSRVLSMRSAFPSLLELETRGRGSIVRGAILDAFSRKEVGKANDANYDLGDVRLLMKEVSVYSFKDGLETLVIALENALKQSVNVDILNGDRVAQLTRSTNGDGKFEIQTAAGVTLKPSHLVSAIPLRALHALLRSSTTQSTSATPLPMLPHLTANPSSSITVVNLVFSSPPGAPALHPPGFGYLVPRPADGYGTPGQNDMGILGTVFDSCALAAQDAAQGVAAITKMTVMMGGPHPHASTSDAEFQETLLRELSTHLSSAPDPPPLPRPLLMRITKSCIPTPTVGHEGRMIELRTFALAEWGAHAAVIGAEVGGVSVPACIEMGRNVGADW